MKLFMFAILKIKKIKKIFTVLDHMQESSPTSKKKFNIKSHKIIRLSTVEKESDLGERNCLFIERSSSKAKVNSLKTIYPKAECAKIRKYTEI